MKDNFDEIDTLVEKWKREKIEQIIHPVKKNKINKMQNVFVIGGGAAGGSIKSIILLVTTGLTLSTIISVVVCAALGALTGWIVKLGLDILKKKYDNNKKRKIRKNGKIY